MAGVTRRIARAVSGVIVAALALGVAADEHRRARELTASGEIVPLGKVVERARGERAGELIEAELERRGEGYVYEIEMLDAQGRVWEQRYDARTGEPIGAIHEEASEGDH